MPDDLVGFCRMPINQHIAAIRVEKRKAGWSGFQTDRRYGRHAVSAWRHRGFPVSKATTASRRNSAQAGLFISLKMSMNLSMIRERFDPPQTTHKRGLEHVGKPAYSRRTGPRQRCWLISSSSAIRCPSDAIPPRDESDRTTLSPVGGGARGTLALDDPPRPRCRRTASWSRSEAR